MGYDFGNYQTVYTSATSAQSKINTLDSQENLVNAEEEKIADKKVENAMQDDQLKEGKKTNGALIGGGVGAAAGIGGAIIAAGLINSWNPAGWVILAIGAVVGIVGALIGSGVGGAVYENSETAEAFDDREEVYNKRLAELEEKEEELKAKREAFEQEQAGKLIAKQEEETKAKENADNPDNDKIAEVDEDDEKGEDV